MGTQASPMYTGRRRRGVLWLGVAAALGGWGPATAWAGAYEDFFAAVKNDRESVVIRLTLQRFDLNTLDEKGEHALLLAIRHGAWKVAAFLLDQPSVKVEVRNAHGESALMLAALKAELRWVQRLIERGAEVNKPGWTALHYAASHPEAGADPVVALLLEHHAYIDAESPNRTTPLMMAARYGHPAVVKRLVEEGADIALRNEQGFTALDFARQGERADAEQLLMAALRVRQAPPAQRGQATTGRW